MLCRISGTLYDSAGQRIRQGKLTVRLQQDIVSVEGQKIVPITIERNMALPMPYGVAATPPYAPDVNLGPLVTPVGGLAGIPSRYYHYFITATDGGGGESLPSYTGSIANAAQVLNTDNYNFGQWVPVPGASGYKIYGRGAALYPGIPSSIFDRYNPAHATLLQTIPATQVYYNPGLQMDMCYFVDQGQTPIGGACPFVNTSGGYVDISLMATVGASPAGVAYFVEFDPDPDNDLEAARSKDGYWYNYWSVPNVPAVPLGSFVSAERGAPYANYMPLGGSVASVGDDLIVGSSPSNTTKSISANQAAFTPKIRFNPGTGHWELSNDGINFFIITPAAVSTYVHTQSVASATWTIVHGKGSLGASIVCTDLSNVVITPTGISYPDNQTAVVTFGSARSGYAYAR